MNLSVKLILLERNQTS